MENEKSYFQAEFGNFKNSESGKAGKNRMRNLILCDLKKNGPDSSSEAKVTTVLGFVDRVGFRDMIYFVDRFGWRGVGRVGVRFCG